MLFIGVRQVLIDRWIELELDIKVTISVDVYVPLTGYTFGEEVRYIKWLYLPW